MVLLTLKNLQQQSFKIEIELSATVKDLKVKIQQEKGVEYPVEGQKLIYTGKILADDQTLESYNMSMSKFIVIMVTKPKPAAVDASSDSKQSTTQQDKSGSSASPESAPSTTPASTTPAPTTPASTTPAPTTPASTPSASTSQGAESLLVTGDEFDKMVTNIMEMGYNRPEVEKALKASFNNPYTAVQYLVDGIPEGVGGDGGEIGGGQGVVRDAAINDATLEAIIATAENNPAGAGGENTGSASSNIQLPSEAGVEPQSLQFLADQPAFIQMARLMRTNPNLLDGFLQQIRNTNPNLFRVIQANPGQFISLINSFDGSQRGANHQGGAPTVEVGGDGSTSIRISATDRAAIERLQQLGNFPEDAVVQAYFACEKNENQAAEFLFSQEWE